MPESPCLKCTKVDDPYECTSKNCPEWKEWFLDRWNKMRKNILSKIKNLQK